VASRAAHRLRLNSSRALLNVKRRQLEAGAGDATRVEVPIDLPRRVILGVGAPYTPKFGVDPLTGMSLRPSSKDPDSCFGADDMEVAPV
jgi:hypothetical protein